jgi:hypothetical protein
VVDYDEIAGTNTNVAIANITNITFSVNQPDVTVNVANDRIWFNGFYTTGNTARILYFEPPYGNDIEDEPSVAFNFATVPPRKYVYKVEEPEPTGVIVTHSFTANYNGGGNGTFTIDRYVYPSIYAAYNFFINYDYYGDD